MPSWLQQVPSATHLEKCSSYCTKCFYFEICMQSYQDYKGRPPCACRCLGASNDHNPGVAAKRDMCRNCAALPKGDALDIRYRRELGGMKILQNRTLQCKGCGKRLPKDKQKWWACSLCNQECMLKEHYVSRGFYSA